MIDMADVERRKRTDPGPIWPARERRNALVAAEPGIVLLGYRLYLRS